ncbi:hypothetical protein LSH36_92g02035 [Paralvinella palmiformis]|uniref:WH1 domain-containing protein n=1 Tax=Paralvinella palmiformis TaxID=53620 RepID=A0AAD9K267_9ANNE|nr:hypothetical protein LSH36_92g02035 [Paralvinella palmiformis]
MASRAVAHDNTGTGGKTMSGDAWRLSRIDEELEKLHFSSGRNAGPVVLPGAKAGTLPRRNTHTQAWDNNIYGLDDSYCGGELYNNSSSTPNLDNTDDIYSKAVVKPAYSGDKLLDSKQAVKFLTGKYDSLGRVKPSSVLAGAGLTTSGQLGVGDASPGSQFDGSDFPPPPPPECLAHMEDFRVGEQAPHFSSKTLPAYEPDLPPAPEPSGLSFSSLRTPKQQSSYGEPSYHHQQGECPAHVPPLIEQELLQVEMFYRSHKTDVFVCQSLANLYFGNIRSSGSPARSVCHIDSGQWQFFKSGIPVLVLDSGQSRRKRKLNIILAERGTGFTLWRDTMNHLTNYTSPQSTFHTMHLSSDHTKLAGFRFVDASAAVDFYHRIFKLVSDPNDDVLNLSGANKGKKNAKHKDKKKYKAPTKADISTPCCFTHITKLDRADDVAARSASSSGSSMQRSLPSSPQHSTAHGNMTASFS